MSLKYFTHCDIAPHLHWGLYKSCPERGKISERFQAQFSTIPVFSREDYKINQKMKLSICFVLGFLSISGPFTQVNADTCAREWLQNQGNCYAYFDQKLTWQEAEIECQSYGRGAHLASILTKSETLLVAEHISTYQKEPSDVWIGLHDVRQTGKWRWADESTYNYKSWMNYQPDNAGNNEYCVELKGSTGFKQWNDIACRKHNAYICKHQL